jgi:hypothetical protein
MIIALSYEISTTINQRYFHAPNILNTKGDNKDLMPEDINGEGKDKDLNLKDQDHSQTVPDKNRDEINLISKYWCTVDASMRCV